MIALVYSLHHGSVRFPNSWVHSAETNREQTLSKSLMPGNDPERNNGTYLIIEQSVRPRRKIRISSDRRDTNHNVVLALAAAGKRCVA